ncbi:DUF4232 domain-containing protein [Frankia sp. AiPa1]|uniref:DUF4232 domain-containing protein n=1 Tax=Frankia sp. AiPa1 TaxID=573492 RepID=UPI00202B2581|nr:DUF4232 domain-containing protein [Frankia sp. AiPa1]MCL9759566.1 DUF4232 domain-containing protein [Frankia sp. AiPa1]
MRRVARVAVVPTVLVVALGLAACDGKSGSSRHARSSAGRSGAVHAASAGSGSSSGSSGSSAAGGSTRSTASARPVSGAVRPCAAQAVTVTLGSSSVVEGDQRERQVRLTNRSSRRCTVSGYPGVSLVARDGAGWDVVRSPLVRPSRITLAPGAAAHASLHYLPANVGEPGGFDATRIQVTPPDTFTTTTLPWDGGPLLDQSGATHPGTYLTALTAG